MTANLSGGIRRTMWCLLIVTHIPGFCYADDIMVSVEDLAITHIDCTYFDCDETTAENEYDSEGIGCINTNLAIIKNIDGETCIVARVFQCILDKCETSLGIDSNETLNNIMTRQNIIKPYFEAINMKISNDCNCIKKDIYTINHHCIDIKSITDQMSGRYLATVGFYKDNNALINIHMYIDAI